MTTPATGATMRQVIPRAARIAVWITLALVAAQYLLSSLPGRAPVSGATDMSPLRPPAAEVVMLPVAVAVVYLGVAVATAVVLYLRARSPRPAGADATGAH